MGPAPVQWADARQTRIHERLDRVSPGLATLFRDAQRLMSGEIGLEAISHFVAHACREIESGLRDVLVGIATLGKIEGHRNEIEAILDSLGIEATNPVGRLWLDLPRSDGALDKMAHRDRLGVRSRTAFDTGWEQFQTILDVVLDRHEATSARAFALIDVLVRSPSPDSFERLQNSVPQNQVTLGYFFDQAGPDWIPMLRASQYLRADDEPVEVGRVRRWPAASWVIRVASADASFVKEVLRGLSATRNAHAAGVAIEIAMKLQPADVAAMVSDVVDWVAVDTRAGGGRGAKVATILAQNGFPTEALAVSRSLLKRPDSADG